MTRLYMRYTKQVSFVWSYKNNIHFDTKSLASLRCLEKLNITVETAFNIPANERYCISDDYETSNLIRFMQNITNLPRLKTLSLCLKGLQMNTGLGLNLLLLVANSNLTDWQISVMLPIKDAKNIHILKPVLARINILGIFTE